MEKISLKLFSVLIPLLFLFPILKENISIIIFIILTINVILYKILIKDFSFNYLKVIPLTIPFWIVFIKSSLSGSFKESIMHIEHSLVFLFFPIVLSLIPLRFFSLKKIEFYIYILKSICFFIALFYISSYMKKFNINDFNNVSYNNSTFRNYIYNDFKIFVIHPAYYTIILVFCVGSSLENVLKKKKYFELIYIALFLIITFLLLTKLNIVLMIVLILFILLFRSGIKMKYRILTTSFLFVFLLCLSIYTPGIKNRFTEIYESIGVKPKDLEFNSTNIRKAIFDCDIALIKDNWLKGVGFNNLQGQLNNCFKSNYDSNFFDLTTYMSHNYYFYMLISSGIIGFIFYLIYILLLIQICLKSNLFLFNILLFSVLIICLVEDFFYRQHGTFYFNLLLMCFINLINYNKQNHIDLKEVPL